MMGRFNNTFHARRETMITMLIIGALVAILRGGGSGYFMIPDLKARVKDLVRDPIRLVKLNGAI
jgi:hypothetical protein